MQQSLLDLIMCPTCNGKTFKLQSYVDLASSIEEGVIECILCSTWFRIENGILDLLPLDLRRWDHYETFARKHSLSLIRESITGEKSKNDQIAFFAQDSNNYENDITNSPVFLALDNVIVALWLKTNSSFCKSLLDIGCGTGRQLIRAAKNGYNIVGIDLSEEMLFKAKSSVVKEKLTDKINLIIADAERLPLHSGVFDSCISVGTLHHVSNPERVIQEISRTLVDGGSVLFYDPHKSSVRFLFDFLMRIWKLYDEKASDNPLIEEADMKRWLSAHNIECTTRLSVFLPPHFFYLLNQDQNCSILSRTDKFFNTIPGLRKCGGILITEGVKTNKR